MYLSQLGLSEKDRLESLGLPTRVYNAVSGAGITTIGDFLTASHESLFGIRNLGPVFVNQLLAIQTYLRTGDPKAIEIQSLILPPEPGVENLAHNPTAATLITNLIDRSGDERTVAIMRRRYGLMTGKRETLEEIGASYGITRERVRQIAQKSIKRLRHPSNKYKTGVINLMKVVLRENNLLINDEDADRVMPGYFPGLQFDGSALLDLFADLGWISSHKIGDIIVYSEVSFDASDVIEKVFRLLTKNRALSFEQIMARLRKPNNPEIDTADWENYVKSCLRLDPRIEEKVDGYYTLYSKHGNSKLWATLITEILEQEGAPLHFTEVADRLNDRLASSNKNLDTRRVHGLLIWGDRFAHTGLRGTYGLTSWGIRKDSTVELIRQCLAEAGFPVHIDQIYNFVKQFKESPRANIKSILESHSYFEKVSSGIYKLK